MPRITPITVLQQPEQPIVSIRARAGEDDLSGVIDDCYAEIAAYLDELGELVCDAPFVAYHNQNMMDLDLEVGFPVSRTLPERGGIKAGSIPAGRMIFSIFRGPYHGIGALYEEMSEWMEDNDLEPLGVAYEYYYNGREYSEDDHLTKVLMPVR